MRFGLGKRKLVPTRKRPSNQRSKLKVAVIPTDRELQIDIDSDRAYRRFKDRFNFFQACIRNYRRMADWKATARVTRSPGGNRHATITLSQRMTQCERICAAVLLGDDPNRGMYNFFRYLNESRFPVMFYEKRRNATNKIHK